MSPATVGAFRRGRPPSRWPRRTQGERTPSGFCGTPTASAAAMPRVRRLRPMARHDGVMRKQKRGGEKKPKTTKEGKSKARRIKEKQKREEAEPRAKRRKRKRALKGIEEKQRPSEREKRRANDLAEKTKREQERGRTEDHPERRTNEESLKPPFKRNEAKDEPLRRKRRRKRKSRPSKPDGNEKAPQ